MAKSDKNFEELMEELNVIVKDLESGNTNLEDSIDKYTKAMTIAKECNEKLENANKSVNKILKDNGMLEDFNVDQDEE